MRDFIKKLVVLQLRFGEVPKEVVASLSPSEREIVEAVGDKFYVKSEMRKRIRIGLTGGVFDVLHIGHIITLTEAKKHCDLMVVAIAKDDHIRKKGREPVHNQDYRKIIVETLKPVDVALSGFDDPKKMIELVKPDVIIYGYDQKISFRPPGVEIIHLERRIDDSKFKTGKILEELGI